MGKVFWKTTKSYSNKANKKANIILLIEREEANFVEKKNRLKEYKVDEICISEIRFRKTNLQK